MAGVIHSNRSCKKGQEGHVSTQFPNMTFMCQKKNSMEAIDLLKSDKVQPFV